VLSARYRLVECASVILFFHVAPAPALLSSSTLFPSSSYEIFKRKEVWKKKKRKQEQGFSLSPGAQEQFSLLLFCLHIKSSSLLCAVCSTLYTFPRNDIVQSSRSRAFCSYYGLQTFTHRESSPHNPQHTRPPFVSPALALLCSALCLVIYPKTYVRARGLVYLLSTIDVRCREV
jgi:hypothetical protein